MPALASLAVMRAAVYQEMGAARDVLRVEEVGRPEPGPGEVLVRVHASGVNPTDFKARGGTTARPIDGFQIPHQDGAVAVADITAALAAGALTELPIHRFPLSETAAAHEAAEGGAVGKVIVTP